MKISYNYPTKSILTKYMPKFGLTLASHNIVKNINENGPAKLCPTPLGFLLKYENNNRSDLIGYKRLSRALMPVLNVEDFGTFQYIGNSLIIKPGINSRSLRKCLKSSINYGIDYSFPLFVKHNIVVNQKSDFIHGDMAKRMVADKEQYTHKLAYLESKINELQKALHNAELDVQLSKTNSFDDAHEQKNIYRNISSIAQILYKLIHKNDLDVLRTDRLLKDLIEECDRGMKTIDRLMMISDRKITSLEKADIPRVDVNLTDIAVRIANNIRRLNSMPTDIPHNQPPRKLTEVENNYLAGIKKRFTENHIEIWLSEKIVFFTEPNIIVPGDMILLRLVLRNLISNAVKYSRKHENIKGHDEKHPVSVIELNITDTIIIDDKPYIRIKVSDNGIGFNLDQAKIIFSLFSTIDSDKHQELTESRHGVGLALTKRIMDLHNPEHFGSELYRPIWAEGEIGEGATFYFILPLSGASLIKTE